MQGSIKLLKTFTIPQIDETLVDFQMDGMPRPLALPRYTETESVRFASVGDLRHGDHSVNNNSYDKIHKSLTETMIETMIVLNPHCIDLQWILATAEGVLNPVS